MIDQRTFNRHRARCVKAAITRGPRKMTTQFDDVVEDAKRRAKEEIAEYLKRQNGSSTVIDKLIKAVSDIHQNKQLDEPTIQELLVLLSCIERLSDDLLAWAKTP